MTADQHVLVELARAAVRAAAPEEIPLFDQTSAAYLRDPELADLDRNTDQPLSFGADAWLPVLTVAALGTAQSALIFLGIEVRNALRDESSSAIRAWVRRLFRGLRPPEEPRAPVAIPRLSPEQLAKVREHAYRQALDFDVPADKAGIMADAIVGRLSLPDDPR